MLESATSLEEESREEPSQNFIDDILKKKIDKYQIKVP